MAHEDNPWAKEAEDNAAKSQRSNVNNMAFKAKSDGEPNYIRILPAKKKGGKPFNKYIVHWLPMRNSTKNRPIFHSIDDKCTVCKMVTKLWSEVHRLKEEDGMTDKSPEVKKLMLQIQAIKGKRTYDMNVIDRDDPVDADGHIKIKRLVAGPTIWKYLLDLGNSKKWGNPSDPGDRGYDVGITVSGEGRSKEYNLTPDPDRKALTDEESEALAVKAYDLEKERPFTTPDDFVEMLENAKLPYKVDPASLKSSMKPSEPEADADSDDDEQDDTAEESFEQPRSAKSGTAPAVAKKPAPAAAAEDEDEDDEPAAPAAKKSDVGSMKRKPAELPPAEEDEAPFTSQPSSNKSKLTLNDAEDEDDEDSSPDSDKDFDAPARPAAKKRNLPF